MKPKTNRIIIFDPIKLKTNTNCSKKEGSEWFLSLLEARAPFTLCWKQFVSRIALLSPFVTKLYLTLPYIQLSIAFNKSSTAYFMGLFKEATNISFVIGIIPINYTSYFSRAPCHTSFSIATLCHGYDKIFLKVIE